MEILEHRAEWEATFQAGFAAYLAQHGKPNFDLYNRVNNHFQPSGRGIDPAHSRLLFVSTAGGYLRDSQEPFDAPNPMGDYSHRLIPMDTPCAEIAYSHEHFDHQFVTADPGVLMPLEHLADMVSEGKIGELAPLMFSYSGYTPDLSRVLDELVPPLIQLAKDQQVNAALLVPS